MTSHDEPTEPRKIPRRAVVAGAVGAAGAAVVGLSACSSDTTASSTTTSAAKGATTTAAAPSASASAGAAVPAILTTDGPDIAAGPRTSTSVALTFHGAGDPALAERMLTTLAARKAHVTVFAVGNWAHANPSVIRALASAGHAVGNHTWSHRAMLTLDAATARTEVQRGADAVAAALGSPGPLFRPSGTPTSNAIVRAAAKTAGYHRCISYDVDSLDYKDPGAKAVVRNVGAGLKAGSIVSLHLGHPGTIEALPGILDLLDQRHLRAVTVPQLLSEPGADVLAKS